MKKKVSTVSKDKWDGYLTSKTEQGKDDDRKDIINRRKDYADDLKDRTSPRRNKNILE